MQFVEDIVDSQTLISQNLRSAKNNRSLDSVDNDLDNVCDWIKLESFKQDSIRSTGHGGNPSAIILAMYKRRNDITEILVNYATDRKKSYFYEISHAIDELSVDFIERLLQKIDLEEHVLEEGRSKAIIDVLTMRWREVSYISNLTCKNDSDRIKRDKLRSIIQLFAEAGLKFSSEELKKFLLEDSEKLR